MPFPAVHRPDVIALPGPVYVKQFTRFAVNRAWNLFRNKASGYPTPQFSGVDEGMPRIEFSARDLKEILDYLAGGDDNLVIGYNTSSTGTISAYYRKGKNKGLPEARADSVHDRWDLEDTGMFYWNKITAKAGKNRRAEIECVIKAISNDGTNPMVHVGSSALVATGATDYLYGLGPVKLNGSFLDSVQSTELDNQLKVDDDKGTDGHPYAMFVDIDEWMPLITIQTHDASVMDDFETPTAVSSLNMFYRKFTKNSLPVADATAEHIRITGAAGTAVATESEDFPGLFTLLIALDSPDDATAPFTVNTAVAIS